jgi:DNA-binding LacI/PurR family transcriptional regulator
MGENLHKISVAVIFLDLTESSIAIDEIIRGVMKAQQKLGLDIKFIPVPSAKSAKEQEQAIEKIIEEGIDGILVASRMPLCIISKLKEKNIKFVWLNNTIPHEEIYSVMFDKNDIYLKIIDRIKELKFKRPAFIAPTLSMEDRKMFLSLCKSAGLGEVKAFTHDILKNDQEMQNIASIDTQQLLSSNYKSDVIICGGEIATTGAVQVLMANNIKIPNDIHIISIVEKENFSLQFPVPIDIIVHSFSEVAIAGLNILNDIFTGENPDYIRYVPLAVKKCEHKR